MNTAMKSYTLEVNDSIHPFLSWTHDRNPPLITSAWIMYFLKHQENALLLSCLIFLFLESSVALNHRHQVTSAILLTPHLVQQNHVQSTLTHFHLKRLAPHDESPFYDESDTT